MASKSKDLDRLIREIRAGFRDLGAFASAIHEGQGVNASMRAVMEFLAEHGPTPAPEIARAKKVTRQHIQTIVDALIDDGRVETRPNPAHKRSVLIALTRKGRSDFKRMTAVEEPALRKIASSFEDGELVAASETIARLRARLESYLEREKADD